MSYLLMVSWKSHQAPSPHLPLQIYPQAFCKHHISPEKCCLVGISVVLKPGFLFLLLRSVKGEELLGFSICHLLVMLLSFPFASPSASHSENKPAGFCVISLKYCILVQDAAMFGHGFAISFEKQTHHCYSWGISFILWRSLMLDIKHWSQSSLGVSL